MVIYQQHESQRNLTGGASKLYSQMWILIEGAPGTRLREAQCELFPPQVIFKDQGGLPKQVASVSFGRQTCGKR